MPGPWRVMSQDIGGGRMYIAGRQIDLNQPLHGGNVEYSEGYLGDRDIVMKRVAKLNGLEVIDLKVITTRDLVAELARREGVCRYVAGPQDRYRVRVRPEEDEGCAKFDLGPATILVVVD